MSTDDNEPLIINGLTVDRRLLEAQPLRRCRLEECQAYCCSGGVAINVKEVEDILAHTELILPHLPPERRDPTTWFDGEEEPDDDHPDGGTVMGTTTVDDATHPVGYTCVFLRPDRKCALQVAGLAAGKDPWRFKPFYCALHPLTFEERFVTLDDENEIYIEGGSCNRPDTDTVIPLFQLFDVELKLALGEAGYAELEAQAQT